MKTAIFVTIVMLLASWAAAGDIEIETRTRWDDRYPLLSTPHYDRTRALAPWDQAPPSRYDSYIDRLQLDGTIADPYKVPEQQAPYHPHRASPYRPKY